MQSPRHATAAVILTVGLLLAGCHNSSPSAASANGSPPAGEVDAGSVAPSAVDPTGHAADACSLVTEQDAATVLGADPGAGSSHQSGAASSCEYGQSPSVLTVNLVPAGGKAAWEHTRSLMAANGVADLSGVGDGAFGLFKGPEAAVEFYQGDVMVAIVLIFGRTGTPHKDQMIALAKAAAGRV